MSQSTWQSAAGPAGFQSQQTYPTECECQAPLVDGTIAHIRPIRPDDAADLVAFHDHLSGETVHLRFFAAHPHLQAEEVARFTKVDYVDRFALVAHVEGCLAAVARYDREPDTDRAEVAFVVADELQGLGLGTLLLEYLAAAARRRGVAIFVAETLGTNRPMQAMFAHAGFPCVQKWGDGVVDVTFPIRPTQSYLGALSERDLCSVHAWLRRWIAPVAGRSRPEVRASTAERFVVEELQSADGQQARLGAACQSPAAAAAIAAACQSQRIEVSAIVASRHEAERDVSDLLAYLAADDDTAIIVVQLDRVTRPFRLEARVRAALRRKPLVAMGAARPDRQDRDDGMSDRLSELWAQTGVETAHGVDALVSRAGEILAVGWPDGRRPSTALPLPDPIGWVPVWAQNYEDDPFVRQVQG